MTVVRVTLSPDLAQFVEAEVLRGDYNSVSAVSDGVVSLERQRCCAGAKMPAFEWGWSMR